MCLVRATPAGWDLAGKGRNAGYVCLWSHLGSDFELGFLVDPRPRHCDSSEVMKLSSFHFPTDSARSASGARMDFVRPAQSVRRRSLPLYN